MNRAYPGRSWSLLLVLTGLVSASAARADALSVVQMLRQGGCGGLVPAAPLLRHNPSLDRAAEQWADGHSLTAAAEGSGYLLSTAQGLDVTGPDESLIQLLRPPQGRPVSS